MLAEFTYSALELVFNTISCSLQPHLPSHKQWLHSFTVVTLITFLGQYDLTTFALVWKSDGKNEGNKNKFKKKEKSRFFALRS